LEEYKPQDTYTLYNRAAEFAAELQASLQEFVSSRVVEVRENGGRVAPFSGMSWEVRGAVAESWRRAFRVVMRQ
jgi:hypothetical protein